MTAVIAILVHRNVVHRFELRLVDRFNLGLVFVPVFLGSFLILIAPGVDGCRATPVTEVFVLLGAPPPIVGLGDNLLFEEVVL